MNRKLTAAVMAASLVCAFTPAVARAQAAAKKPAAAKPAAAKPATAAGVEAEIEKMEKERAAAAVKADTVTLEKMTSEDYTFINRNGKMSNRAETMKALKSGDIKLTANDVSDLKVRLYGNTAVVTGRVDVKGTIGGKDATGPALFTRVYVKKDGHWQSVAFQQTPVLP